MIPMSRRVTLSRGVNREMNQKPAAPTSSRSAVYASGVMYSGTTAFEQFGFTPKMT